MWIDWWCGNFHRFGQPAAGNFSSNFGYNQNSDFGSKFGAKSGIVQQNNANAKTEISVEQISAALANLTSTWGTGFTRKHGVIAADRFSAFDASSSLDYSGRSYFWSARVKVRRRYHCGYWNELTHARTQAFHDYSPGRFVFSASV